MAWPGADMREFRRGDDGRSCGVEEAARTTGGGAVAGSGTVEKIIPEHVSDIMIQGPDMVGPSPSNPAARMSDKKKPKTYSMEFVPLLDSQEYDDIGVFPPWTGKGGGSGGQGSGSTSIACAEPYGKDKGMSQRKGPY